jgi:TolB protein
MPDVGGSETEIDTGFNDPIHAALNFAGTTVAFSCLGFTFDIFSIGLSGGSPVLLSDGLSDALWPCFSPDGTQVLYTGTPDGIPQLYTMNSGGGGVIALTNQVDGAVQGKFNGAGTKIVFVSGSTNDDVFVMDSNGANIQQLTNNAAGESQPAFSPDGAKVVYVRDMGSGGNFNGQLWIMNADGTGQARLTTTLADDQEPSFTADGTAILFTRSTGGGSREIFRIPVGGGTAVALTSDGAVASSPSTGN